MTPDVICLVADKNIEAVLESLFRERQAAIGIASLAFEIHVHPQRDPGCFLRGARFLSQLLAQGSARGLLVFDYDWDGNLEPDAISTEEAVRRDLTECGIADRAEVVVIEPEVEAWVWSESPHVGNALGWEASDVGLRQWLEAHDLWPPGHGKPPDPKAAVEAALYERRVPRSSSIYRQLASRVSLQRCEDPSFARLCVVLRRWFGEGQPARRGQQ